MGRAQHEHRRRRARPPGRRRHPRLHRRPYAEGDPAEDVQGSWKVAGPATVDGFTAAGYYFAHALRAELKQPVGIIHTSIGGTRAEAWGPRGMYDAQPEAKGWQEKEDKGVADRVAKAKTDPKTQTVWSNGPHMNWNGMVAPLVGYSFKGALWYQGESNAGQAAAYKWILGDMIKAWHKAWGREFPFIIVQLPRFMAKKPVAVEDGGWPVIRESMEWIADHVPGAMMSVNIDLGEEKDIHPKDKLPIGERLAAVALQRVYKTRAVGEAPRVTKAELRATPGSSPTTVRSPCRAKARAGPSRRPTAPGLSPRPRPRARR